jgi:hypothetical protein
MLLPEDAKALSPARPEQFVCSASRIFVGHVLKATNDDRLNLTIRVDQILGIARTNTVSPNVSSPIVERNDIVTTSSTISQALKNIGSWSGSRQIYDNDPGIIPLFIDKEFIFGTYMYWLLDRYELGVDVWQLKERDWIQRTLTGCNHDG